MSFCQIVFSNGVSMRGQALGADGRTVGRVMPYTSMTDYQAILSDPAISGQIVCMAYPLIGNVGLVQPAWDGESLQAAGVIIRESIPEVDHWQSRQNLRSWLKEQGVVAIGGVDTREIIRMLRKGGPLVAIISTDPLADPAGLAEEARSWQPGSEIPARETMQVFPSLTPERCHLAVLDLGTSPALMLALNRRGCRVSLIPAPAKAGDILAEKPDAVLLSGGPEEAVILRESSLLDSVSRLKAAVPVWGIDAGHLLLARSFGLELSALSLGHHGANYPVHEKSSGRTYMTSQHHRLAVASHSLTDLPAIQVTHFNINDQSVEGLDYGQGHRSVQFIPDDSREKHQTGHIWDEWIAGLVQARE